VRGTQHPYQPHNSLTEGSLSGKQPLLLPLLGYVTGVVTAPAEVGWEPAVTCAAAGWLSLLLARTSLTWPWQVLLFLGWVAAGQARMAGCRASLPHVPEAPAGPEHLLVHAVGVVESLVARLPVDGEGRPWETWKQPILSFRLTQVQVEGPSGRRELPGKLLVRMPFTDSPLQVGHRVSLKGQFSWLSHRGNPGTPCSACRLRDEGVLATVWCPRHELVQILQWDLQYGSLLPAWLGDRVNRKLHKTLGPCCAPVAAALIVGNYEQIPKRVVEDFRSTGLLHVLAVSGMHVYLVTWISWTLGRCLGLGLAANASLSMMAMVLFAGLAGFGTPVLRASILALVTFGSYWVWRASRRLNSLALAALVSLWVHPLDFRNPGFQLSFLAVGALYWLVGPISAFVQSWIGSDNPLDRLGRSWLYLMLQWVGQRLVEATIASSVIWLVTTPVLAAHFGVAPVATIFVTPFLVPLVSAVLFFSFALLLLPGETFWGRAMAWVAEQCLHGMLTVVSSSSKPPWAQISVQPDQVHIGALIVGMVLVVLAVSAVRRLRRSAGTSWSTPSTASVMAAAVSAAAGLLVSVLVPHGSNRYLRSWQWQCTFLDVGHGLCVLIQEPRGTVLYDVGSLRGSRVAGQTAVRALRWFGVSAIDAVVLSHPDLDHCNGLLELLEHVTVKRVVVSPAWQTSRAEVADLIVRQLERKGIPMETCSTKHSWRAAVGAIQVLHPPAERLYRTDNENSLVLLVQLGPVRLLLTGDLEGGALEELMARGLPSAEILAAPHHGSARSMPQELARRCHAQWVVVSGELPWGRPDTSWHFSTATPRWLVTGREGAVTLLISNDGTVLPGLWWHGRFSAISIPRGSSTSPNLLR
jgi:competence protein ComEC